MPTTPNNTTASQHAGRSRRGSALIITVGTLALIAVIAAFYVTLGQADSRVSEGVERSASVRNVETQVADHIAQIIAIDRTATTIETLAPDENDVGGTFDSSGNPVTPVAADRQRFVREATDYPFTDLTFKSVFVDGNAGLGEAGMRFDPRQYANTPDVFDGSSLLSLAAAAERFRFRPAGDHTTMLDADGTLISSGDDQMLRDYRVASDPWLAASEPTFTGLGDPDNNPSTLPAERRVFSVDAFFRSNIPGARLDELTYLDNRDWAQISNLAPDGLSINLWNLRGNFDAESGLGTDPDGRARMSENRTLLTLDNPTGGTPETDYQIRASDRLHFDPDGDIVPSFLANTPEAFAIRNTPAWWTMNQRFLYFPADRDFQILGRPDAATSPSTSTVIQTWGTPDFPDYQYADADGDGFYDSRWFELADSTLGRLGSHSLLENETNLRFVVAARVIDLSARVNVNSATDGLVPPTSDVPAGATPAEIDLRRLLTGQDAAEQYRPVFANTDNTINDDNERLSYAHIRRLAFNDRQENNPGRLIAGDYEDYLTSRDFTAAVEPRITVLTGPGLSTGRFAYDALRRELQGDELYLPSLATNRRAPDDAGNPYTTPLSLKDGSPFEYFNYNGLVANQDDKLYPTSPIFGTDVVFGTWNFAGENAASLRALPRWRRDSWFDIGGVNIADPDALSETKLGLGARPFGLDDLAELLAFNGVNDDRILSRLERVTQGRYDNGQLDIVDSSIRFGPLRANRPTSLERTNHDTRTNRDAPSATQFPVPDNLIDDEPFILNAVNPRLRLTTISGAAPLRSRVVEDVDGDGVLSAAERRLTSLDARLDLMPSDVVVNENSSISGTALSVTGINTFGRDDTPDGSFVRDGFTVGMEIFARGFDDPANNGRFTVTAVTDAVLTVAEDLEVETQGPGREIAQLSDAERPERLFTYYADALAPYSEIDATWNNNPEGADAGFGAASQINYPRMRTLAYGYRGSELALRLSAHLALNMADMVDADDEPLAYTVVASPRNDVRRNLNTQWPNTLGDNNPYVWWNDGNRLDLGEGGDADNKLAPREQDVNTDFSRIAYNAYGVEAQPVITEVSVLTVYNDVPRAPIGVASIANGFDGTVMTEDESVGDYPGFNEEDADQTVNPDDPDEYQPSDPSDDGSDDDITIRADISPENPDLVAHVLAIQLTNPFDVPIELSGADTSPNPLADGGALNTQNNLQLEAVKYYIEFNGHFFPLAEFFERAANINPATGFGGGPGPTAFQRYQVMRTDIGEQNRTQTNKLYGVTLQPGESRVFYVSAHPWIEGMNRRWREIDSVYGDVAGGDDLINDSGVLEAPVTNRDNRNLFEEFISAQYTVRRADGQPQHMELISADTHNSPGALFRADTREPVRLVPFDPRSGELAPAGQGGAFVDFLRTSAAVRVPNSDLEADRMRQEVRLWRRMTNEDSSNFTAVTEEKEIFENGTPTNLIENDLLVDRMRDPMLPLETSVQTGATVDFAVFNETQRQEIVNRPVTEFLSTINSSTAPPAGWTTAVNETIPNTTSTDDNNGQWSNTSQGLTIVRFAGYRRPDHLAANPTPGEDAEVVRLRGLLPAWATESREMNYNIAIPTMLDVDRDTDGDGSPDDPALGTVPPALEALDNIMTADILDSSLGGEMVGWQNNEGFVQDSDHDPYYSRNLRSMMLKAMPPNEINTEDENTLIFDHWSLVPSIARHPDYKVEPDVFQADPFNFATATRSGLNAAGEIRPNGPYTPSVLNTEERTVGTNFPSYMNDRQSLLFNTSDRFGFDGDEPRTTRIRVGDILAPLAVGPTFAPRLTLGTPWPWAGPANFRPGDWTTLAEALSAALGLEPPAFYYKDPNDIGYSLLSELVERRSIDPFGAGVFYDSLDVDLLPSEELGPMVDSRVEFVLDNGRLHLGEYTPFYNGNLGVNLLNVVDGGAPIPNPTWGSVSFNPTEAGNTGTDTDRRVAFSVPPAQRLLSMVQGVHRGGDFLTTPVIGTVNINTATDPVLRTIPGLATSMQFSESKVDYDQYDVDENHDGTTDVTSLATNGRLMEWVPGRVGARSHLFTNPFDPDDIALREPMAFGLGNPFELNGQFAGDGWRNVGEAAPSVLGIRDRTASIFRRAAKRPGGGSGSEGILNGIGAQGAGVAPEIIFDFTPDAQFVNSYAYGPDAFGAGSSSAAQRMRDLMATNYDLDYGRAAINGQTAASERPGFSGIGSLLGLDVPYYEPLSDKTIYEIRNPKIQARVAADANGLFPLWFRTRPTDLPINRIQVRGETLQGTMTRLGNDYLDSDDADFTDDFDNVRAGRALSAMNQDRNGIADPDGDGNEILRNHAVEDGYDPIIDPIEDDNYSYTLGRAFFGNENSDDDLRPNVLEDELANDLLEELAIFNGAANTIDTRSDFFAAWFVLRGYSQNDVSGLDPEEPMTPSYQKRFLMVIDRSNVTDAGQSPRILYFGEVPL